MSFFCICVAASNTSKYTDDFVFEISITDNITFLNELEFDPCPKLTLGQS